jgi:nucleoside-diphosphate-sugar epimerase
MYRQIPPLSFFSNPNFKFVEMDVANFTSLEKIVEKENPDFIIPLAAIVGAPACEKNKETASKVNFHHVKFLSDFGKKVLYPNSNSGYGATKDEAYCTEETPMNPISHYGVTKCQAEDSVIRNGGVAFRLATVMGLSQRFRADLLVNDFTIKAKKDGFIVLFEKHFKRNYIHVKDVSKAFIHAMNNYDDMKGQCYNVGLSSANLSKLELCHKIKEYVPNFSIQSDEYSKDKDQRNYIVSNEKLEKTGWFPDYSLDDAIKEIIHAYPVIEKQLQNLTNLT